MRILLRRGPHGPIGGTLDARNGPGPTHLIRRVASPQPR